MIDIKFRAIIAGTDKFIYGLPHAVYPENYIDSIQSIKDKQVEYIRTDTLGQFIGLIDINKKEIYKGDITKDALGALAEVIFNDGSFKEFSKIGYSPLTQRGIIELKIEVIGNIHQNPEILL